MNETLRKLTIDGEDFERKTEDSFDLDDLLHPAQAFSHPSDVVNDPDLTLNEKRAILASWASDACAVESVPALRRAPVARRQAGRIRRCHGRTSRAGRPCDRNQQSLPPRPAKTPDFRPRQRPERSVSPLKNIFTTRAVAADEAFGKAPRSDSWSPFDRRRRS